MEAWKWIWKKVKESLEQTQDHERNAVERIQGRNKEKGTDTVEIGMARERWWKERQKQKRRKQGIRNKKSDCDRNRGICGGRDQGICNYKDRAARGGGKETLPMHHNVKSDFLHL